jgi:hypothetical protein
MSTLNFVYQVMVLQFWLPWHLLKSVWYFIIVETAIGRLDAAQLSKSTSSDRNLTPLTFNFQKIRKENWTNLVARNNLEIFRFYIRVVLRNFEKKGMELIFIDKKARQMLTIKSREK